MPLISVMENGRITQAIANDLNMPPLTVKSLCKISSKSSQARQSSKSKDEQQKKLKKRNRSIFCLSKLMSTEREVTFHRYQLVFHVPCTYCE
ncbi:hypothetical protein [Anabaena sp. CCY 9910]|uniref:hypothetical protein n=1 Tax=Anabaena sp. CCY 9910 TaxID=3103870 RepID=UPI0039E0C7B7